MTGEEMKRQSVREFTRAARAYEGDHAGIYAMCKEDYPDILAELEKEPFQDLLDAGCGPGPMISLLAEKYPDRRYVGIDFTPAMIEAAKRKALPNAEFVIGDCENLPFPAESFDAVICSMSFHHYPNPQAFLSGVRRVLRPGGRLVLRDMTGPGWMMGLVNHVELPLARLFGKGDVRGYTVQEARAMLEEAGLRVECVQRRPKFRLHCVARKEARG